jgi:hypothetical protein
MAKQAFICFTVVYNQMRHEMVYVNHDHVRPREPNLHYHCLRLVNTTTKTTNNNIINSRIVTTYICIT